VLWEDFYDNWLAAERADEPREDLRSVRHAGGGPAGKLLATSLRQWSRQGARCCTSSSTLTPAR
jgi:hypothetical protein